MRFAVDTMNGPDSSGSRQSVGRASEPSGVPSSAPVTWLTALRRKEEHRFRHQVEAIVTAPWQKPYALDIDNARIRPEDRLGG